MGMIYVAGVVFAVIRIITAIFLKETLTAANRDAELCAMQQMNFTVRRLFNETDESGDGNSSLREFESMCSHANVKAWLKFLDLDLYEAHTLFYLLDDGDGQINFDEFVNGVLRLKGQSRAIDSAAIQQDIAHILERVDDLVMATNQSLTSPIVACPS